MPTVPTADTSCGRCDEGWVCEEHPDQPVALMRQANAARDRVSMLVFAVLVMIGQSLAEDN